MHINVITQVFAGNVDANDLAKIEIRNKIGSMAEEIHRTKFGDYCAISDILL